MSFLREFQYEVEKGAEFLDAQKPGWEKKINPELLDLSHSCKCILGQVYGDYGDGFVELGLSQVEDRAALGFTIDQRALAVKRSFTPLTREWLLYLAERAAAPFKAAAKKVRK